MSRSNLYRLLEQDGGIARYISASASAASPGRPLDPATTQSISAIAEDLCFSNLSSFSRTFKREFGYSPSEARYAALAGLKPPSAPKSRLLTDRVDFGELLRRF
jgi:AraC-like DNA-binding protein